jgi:hypothetical protein
VGACEDEEDGGKEGRAKARVRFSKGRAERGRRRRRSRVIVFAATDGCHGSAAPRWAQFSGAPTRDFGGVAIAGHVGRRKWAK